MSLLRRKVKWSSFQPLLAIVHWFGKSVCFDALDICSCDCLLNRVCLAHDAKRWSFDLDFEGWQRRDLQNERFQDWCNLEMFALPQRDFDCSMRAF